MITFIYFMVAVVVFMIVATACVCIVKYTVARSQRELSMSAAFDTLSEVTGSEEAKQYMDKYLELLDNCNVCMKACAESITMISEAMNKERADLDDLDEKLKFGDE